MIDDANRFRVTSLFWETRVAEREARLPPLFTLKDSPHTVASKKNINGLEHDSVKTYPSLKQIYFSYDHVPGFEYEFAMDVFGCWEHWLRLCRSTLKGHFEQWREELTVKLKCDAMRKMMTTAKESSTTGFNAAKYLADEGYVAAKKGRITKEDKERQLRIAAGINDSLSEDMERVFALRSDNLQVVNGGK
ncbi:hypothetical protein [Caudoviricetes sp.]|nr:hypothetical protein [Caudoviricetes sp.]